MIAIRNSICASVKVIHLHRGGEVLPELRRGRPEELI
jgi:hypothetical protein